MQRTWAKFEVKNLNNDARTFSGTASTPSLDLAGDTISPLGARFSLPLPLLLNHDSARPIGWVRSATATAAGLAITGQIANIAEPPSLREELDRSWAMVQNKLMRGLSVGFKTLKEHPIATGFHISEWLLLEISCVVIPANADCSITAIKAADRAACGRGSALDSREQRELLGRMSARADPGVAMARRARLLREAGSAGRGQTTMQYFSTLE